MVIKGYEVIVEQAEGNLSAYVPKLPGCVTVAGTVEELETLMAEAIDFHIEGMQLAGETIPQP